MRGKVNYFWLKRPKFNDIEREKLVLERTWIKHVIKFALKNQTENRAGEIVRHQETDGQIKFPGSFNSRENNNSCKRAFYSQGVF